mgnify:CR=1 FL=1
MLKGFRLEKQLEYLETILNTVQAGINVIDKDGIIIYVNDAYCKMNGYEKEELLGNSLKLILPDKNPKKGLENYKKIIGKKINKPFIKESYNIKKNGEKFPVLISWNYLFDNDELQGMVTVVQDISRLKYTESALRQNRKKLKKITQTLEEKKHLISLMGNSDIIKNLYQKVKKIAVTDFSVLITGETGSGKEIIANSIHHLSKRNKKPFIKIDCGAISESLIETELFGHTKGAFTDAKNDKKGAFQQANTGTIFLDEITNLSFKMQKKLLRVIQEKEIKQIGSEKTIKLDIRIITASNKNMNELVKQGNFRDDLFFRLNEFTIQVPPLRKRKEDIPYLVERFIKETCQSLDCDYKPITTDALKRLSEHNWPGNVRELINVIKHAIVLSDKEIKTKHLIFHDTHKVEAEKDTYLPDLKNKQHIDLKKILKKQKANLEKTIIDKALKKFNGNKSKTSKFLNIDYKTILNKIKKYNLE